MDKPQADLKLAFILRSIHAAEYIGIHCLTLLLVTLHRIKPE